METRISRVLLPVLVVAVVVLGALYVTTQAQQSTPGPGQTQVPQTVTVTVAKCPQEKEHEEKWEGRGLVIDINKANHVHIHGVVQVIETGKHGRGLGHLYNLTTLTGTVVNKSTRAPVITLSVDGRNYTIVLLREYVRESDGALVYGPWLFSSIKTGDSLTIKTVILGNRTVAPALSLTLDGQTYTTPALYRFQLFH